MSAPVNVNAAIRHAVSALHGAADDGADTRRYADSLHETGVAVAELIAACKARDSAREAAHEVTRARLDARRAGLPEPDQRETYAAAAAADERYLAALAACTGVAP